MSEDLICEIRSGHNGVFDCTRAAIGTWQFADDGTAFSEPIRVCKWHTNFFTRKGHWDSAKAFKELAAKAVQA